MIRVGVHGAGMTGITSMVNGAVGGVVENPWWDPGGDGLCVWAAYQPKGAANLAASYIDLSGNGNNCGLGNAPAWNALSGWLFNGINDYLATAFIPQNDQSQTMIAQFTNLTNVEAICGTHTAPNRSFDIYPDLGGGAYYLNGGWSFAAPAYTTGNGAVAGNQGYRNGAADGGAIGAWAGVSNFTVTIGASNAAGGPHSYGRVYMQAFALYDCTLTAPQVSAVATAMSLL